jgi:23S rRNA pseudouridine1911/1915/1917 synthase
LPHNTLNWIVKSRDNNRVLKEFLYLQGISKRALTQIKFYGGKILVNNVELNVRKVLSEDDIVTIIFPQEKRSPEMAPENIELDIVYEDEFILVINKQAGMPTIPSRQHPTGTLANAVLYYYDQNNLSFTFHAVNRLDRDTSGLLIIAKNSFVHNLFAHEQKKGTIKRKYKAIVHGELEGKGIVNAPIGRKQGSIIERCVTEDGQSAITHFEVLNKKNEYSLVELSLETGRTHQIRVHMAHLGHPLVGDDLYGGSTNILNRQALHSYSINFFHPILLKELKFESVLPEDMEKFLRANIN